ncbi:hypothetical protein BGW80DRAFT_1230262 [Lactifluus volemus]|nr:hypothetical protein BGW80DRAFT_1230262 [Lactifluus volemus]
MVRRFLLPFVIQSQPPLLSEARDNPDLLGEDYPSIDKDIPVGDVFTSCNWVLPPKSAIKRVFLITDNDNPLASSHNSRLVTSTRTKFTVPFQDLSQAGVTIEPFFITTDDKPLIQHKICSVRAPISCSCGPFLNIPLQSVLVASTSLSISRIDDLLEQIRFHKAAKRALFSIPFGFATRFIIGIKGYGLITERKRVITSTLRILGTKWRL